MTSKSDPIMETKPPSENVETKGQSTATTTSTTTTNSGSTSAKSLLSQLRIAVLGNVDSGKSTLVGVLTSGEKDDGRGLARSKVFLYRHELQSGRTSSVGQHIVGYTSKHEPVYQTASASAPVSKRYESWSRVVHHSSKIVTLIDLAGHEQYLKTTVAGLTGCFPDYALVVVNSLSGISKMTREHMGLLLSLSIPFACVITKMDLCPTTVLERTIKSIKTLLKASNVRKLPILIKDSKDVQLCTNDESGRITPLFLVSSVSGAGVDVLQSFLPSIPTRATYRGKENDPLEFVIDDTYKVSGVGLVLAGTVVSGTLSVGMDVQLGPFDHDGYFIPIRIRSIHIRRVESKYCPAGTTCAISLRVLNNTRLSGTDLTRTMIRPGMVLLDSSVTKPLASKAFDANVCVLHHPTTIETHYQSVLHCGQIRQTARMELLNAKCLRTGDQATVRFRFLQRPEWIHVGSVVLFREGTTKGTGVVTKVYNIEEESKLPTTDSSSTSKQRKRHKKHNASWTASSTTKTESNASDMDPQQEFKAPSKLKD